MVAMGTRERAMNQSLPQAVERAKLLQSLLCCGKRERTVWQGSCSFCLRVEKAPFLGTVDFSSARGR